VTKERGGLNSFFHNRPSLPPLEIVSNLSRSGELVTFFLDLALPRRQSFFSSRASKSPNGNRLTSSPQLGSDLRRPRRSSRFTFSVCWQTPLSSEGLVGLTFLVVFLRPPQEQRRYYPPLGTPQHSPHVRLSYSPPPGLPQILSGNRLLNARHFRMCARGNVLRLRLLPTDGADIPLSFVGLHRFFPF